MKINCENVVLLDNNYKTGNEFITGLSKTSKLKWQPLLMVSNKSRKNKFYNIIRYISYFLFPFFVFTKRKHIKRLIGWQAFYAINFAFYCNLFKTKKTTFVVIKNFIYKSKSGVIGKIYYKYLKYVVCSNYVDKIIVSSPNYAEECVKNFNIPRDKFVVVKFGVEDFSNVNQLKNSIVFDDFVFSIGRSNRDWNFLIESFKSSKRNLIIASDTYNGEEGFVAPNIYITKSVTGDLAYEYFEKCKFLIVPVLDGTVASGDTVVITGYIFSKPAIVTKPSTIAEYYVYENITGFAVEKNKNDLLKKVEMLYLNDDKYISLCKNSRRAYEKDFSLKKYGEKVGNIFI